MPPIKYQNSYSQNQDRTKNTSLSNTDSLALEPNPHENNLENSQISLSTDPKSTQSPHTRTQKDEIPPQGKLTKTLLRRILIFTTFIASVAIVVPFLLNFLSTDQEFISPVPEKSDILSSYTETPLEPKEIVGFLPYWNLKEEENFRYHLLTQVAFFALEIDDQGNIKKLKKDGTEEPGWTAYKSVNFGTIYRKAKDSGTKVILTIQSMDHDTITSILNNQNHRKTAIEQTLEIIELKNLDGVNIDFEYAGSPAYQTTKNFTQFVKEFRQALSQKNPNLILNIDVFADASNKVRLWDIPQIAEYVDQVIIMAYDFHRASSSIAAPVAPIRGAPKHWQYDIIKTLTDFSKIIPLSKIILGVPYYGYEWRTTSKDQYATTYPNSGSLATFKRVQSLIKESQPQLDWDETALAPRLTYVKDGNIHQIYYDNETSLGLKYDLVHESGIAGIAIWALGYDGSYSNLWNLLSEKFAH